MSIKTPQVFCLPKLDNISGGTFMYMLYCSFPIFCETVTILHSPEENGNWGRIAIPSRGAQKRSGKWRYLGHWLPKPILSWTLHLSWQRDLLITSGWFAFDNFTFSVIWLCNQTTDFKFMKYCFNNCHLGILHRNLGVFLYISFVFQSLSQPFS